MTTLTRLLGLAALPAAEIPASARATARFSLFDWMVCGRAGVGEPLVGICATTWQQRADVVLPRSLAVFRLRRGRWLWSTAQPAMRWIMMTHISAMWVTPRSGFILLPWRWGRRLGQVLRRFRMRF